MFNSNNNSYISDKDKVKLDKLNILNNIDNSLREIKDLLKIEVEKIRKDDNTFASIKDKDLIKLEFGASKNKNKTVLELVRSEMNRRGLFIEEPIVGTSKEIPEKVTVDRIRRG